MPDCDAAKGDVFHLFKVPWRCLRKIGETCTYSSSRGAAAVLDRQPADPQWKDPVPQGFSAPDLMSVTCAIDVVALPGHSRRALRKHVRISTLIAQRPSASIHRDDGIHARSLGSTIRF